MKNIGIRLVFASMLVMGALAPRAQSQGSPCHFKGFPFRVCASTSQAATPASPVALFTVVADGLQSPRGLTFGPGGRLYVAQAGEGGATPTGKITEILYPWLVNPETQDIVTGLISVGKEGDIVGVAGLSAVGDGTIYAAMELSNAGTGGFP